MQRAIPLAAALLAGALGLLNFFHNIELQTYDLRVEATARPSTPATDIVLNVASGQEISLHELAVRLARVMGREDLRPELRPRRAVNPVPRRLADTTAAEREIGFRSTIDFDEGLRLLVAWWRREHQRSAALTAGQAAL